MYTAKSPPQRQDALHEPEEPEENRDLGQARDEVQPDEDRAEHSDDPDHGRTPPSEQVERDRELQKDVLRAEAEAVRAR